MINTVPLRDELQSRLDNATDLAALDDEGLFELAATGRNLDLNWTLFETEVNNRIGALQLTDPNYKLLALAGMAVVPDLPMSTDPTGMLMSVGEESIYPRLTRKSNVKPRYGATDRLPGVDGQYLAVQLGNGLNVNFYNQDFALIRSVDSDVAISDLGGAATSKGWICVTPDPSNNFYWALGRRTTSGTDTNWLGQISASDGTVTTIKNDFEVASSSPARVSLPTTSNVGSDSSGWMHIDTQGRLIVRRGATEYEINQLTGDVVSTVRVLPTNLNVTYNTNNHGVKVTGPATILISSSSPAMGTPRSISLSLRSSDVDSSAYGQIRWPLPVPVFNAGTFTGASVPLNTTFVPWKNNTLVALQTNSSTLVNLSSGWVIDTDEYDRWVDNLVAITAGDLTSAS